MTEGRLTQLESSRELGCTCSAEIIRRNVYDGELLGHESSCPFHWTLHLDGCSLPGDHEGPCDVDWGDAADIREYEVEE